MNLASFLFSGFHGFVRLHALANRFREAFSGSLAQSFIYDNKDDILSVIVLSSRVPLFVSLFASFFVLVWFPIGGDPEVLDEQIDKDIQDLHKIDYFIHVLQNLRRLGCWRFD